MFISIVRPTYLRRLRVDKSRVVRRREDNEVFRWGNSAGGLEEANSDECPVCNHFMCAFLAFCILVSVVVIDSLWTEVNECETHFALIAPIP